MEKLIFTSEDGEKLELMVQAQVRMGGVDYILVSEEDDDGAEAWILKDISGTEEDDARYVGVEDDDELRAILPLFEEILDEMDIDMEEA